MSETRERLRDLLQKLRLTGKVTLEERDELIRAQDLNVQTGPAVGERVPDFTLPDWAGRSWSLSDLLGPEGLIVVYHRSAGW